MNYNLTPNLNWPCAPASQSVSVFCHFTPNALQFAFDVTEPQDCFRCECGKNGDPCWQDSCVEVFLHSPMHGGYYNFECNSAGICLAEFGLGRSPRRQFDPDEYELFGRSVLTDPERDETGLYHWMLELTIPRTLVGISPSDIVFGNLYKCASAAATPHYLTAFPIQAPAPDFHRPEFFREIDGSI